MSNADSVRLSYVEEVTYGVTPVTGLTDLRMTSESLGQDSSSISSNEIEVNRNVSDVVRTDLAASGDVNLELSYGTYDDMFESVLQSAAWTTGNSDSGTDIEVTAAGTFEQTGGDWTTPFAVNDWIKVAGFTDSANNGYFKVVTVAATVMTVTPASLVVEAVGDSVTITAQDKVQNGSTFRSFSFEKDYQDLDTPDEFETLIGMVPESFSLSIAPQQIVTGTFGFLGKSAASSQTATAGGYTTAPTNEVYNAITSPQRCLENAIAFNTTAVNFTLNNNLRQRLEIKSLGAISIGSGKVDVTGTVQMYFTSPTIYDKFLNDTATSLAFAMEDSTGKAYVFDFPQVKYSAGRRPASGTNSDVIVDLNFVAYKHATEAITLNIGRWAS